MQDAHLHELDAEKQLISEFMELPAVHYPYKDWTTFLDTQAIHIAIQCDVLGDSTFSFPNHWASDARTYRIVQPSKSSTHLQQQKY